MRIDTELLEEEPQQDPYQGRIYKVIPAELSDSVPVGMAVIDVPGGKQVVVCQPDREPIFIDVDDLFKTPPDNPKKR